MRSQNLRWQGREVWLAAGGGVRGDDSPSWLSLMRLPTAIGGSPGSRPCSPPGSPPPALQQAPPPQALLAPGLGEATPPGASTSPPRFLPGNWTKSMMARSKAHCIRCRLGFCMLAARERPRMRIWDQKVAVIGRRT